MVKLNTDGNWDGANGFWAAVIRGRQGEVLAMAKGVARQKRIDLIELEGVMHGIELAEKYGYQNIEAETDSTTVKFYMQSEQIPWETKKMVERIKRQTQQLNTFTINHQYREANRLADRIAAMGASTAFEEIFSPDLSNECIRIIREDADGKLYERV